MIHILEVSPRHSVAEIMKLTRRFAMTGGVELALPREVSIEELANLANLWIPELSSQPGSAHEHRTSNAYRILELIKESPTTSEDTRQAIQSLIG